MPLTAALATRTFGPGQTRSKGYGGGHRKGPGDERKYNRTRQPFKVQREGSVEWGGRRGFESHPRAGGRKNVLRPLDGMHGTASSLGSPVAEAPPHSTEPSLRSRTHRAGRAAIQCEPVREGSDGESGVEGHAMASYIGGERRDYPADPSPKGCDKASHGSRKEEEPSALSSQSPKSDEAGIKPGLSPSEPSRSLPYGLSTTTLSFPRTGFSPGQRPATRCWSTPCVPVDMARPSRAASGLSESEYPGQTVGEADSTRGSARGMGAVSLGGEA